MGNKINKEVVLINDITKLEDGQYRSELIQKSLEHSKKFNCDRCFDETYRFYQEVWNRKFGE